MRHRLANIVAACCAVLAGAAPAITLEDCIQTALQENPDMAAAAQRIASAQAALRQAESGYYPWLSLNGSYMRTDNPPQAFMMTLNQRQLNMMAPEFDPNDPDDTDNIRWSIAAKYRLFDGGQRESARGAALSGTRLAQSGQDAARNELVHQVTRAYLNTLQARAFVDVQAAMVTSLEESQRVARERFQAGSAVKTDVLNLDVKLAEAREDLIRARNGLRLAEAALNTAIGVDVARADDLQPPPEPETEALADASRAGPENRPELRLAAEQVTLSQHLWRRARRGFSPALNAFGSLDWDSDDWRDYENSYMAGIMAEWEIFDGFRRPNAIRQASAELARARAELRKTRLNVQFDLTQAQLSLGEARERIEVMHKNVENAREALRITRERYQQGAADITELLTAEVGLHALQTRDVAARYDLLIAQSNLKRACGALAEKYPMPAKQPD